MEKIEDFTYTEEPIKKHGKYDFLWPIGVFGTLFILWLVCYVLSKYYRCCEKKAKYGRKNNEKVCERVTNFL